MALDAQLYDRVSSQPVIPAIKNDEGLEKVCTLPDCSIVFVLYGDICNIDGIVARLHRAGKLAFVHVDLIAGFSSKEICVDFLRKIGADGVISTKASMIRRARELSMYTVMRFFILDSMALGNIEKQLDNVQPDLLEILPGIIPRMTKATAERVRRFGTCVVAGGLIVQKQDILDALDAGAIAVSSTNQSVWFM